MRWASMDASAAEASTEPRRVNRGRQVIQETETMHFLLADEVDFKSSLGNIIFMGCFILALIAALIWWLRRG